MRHPEQGIPGASCGAKSTALHKSLEHRVTTMDERAGTVLGRLPMMVTSEMFPLACYSGLAAV